LFAGVPLPVAGAFLMLAGFVIVILQNPLYELVMAPLWFGAKVVVSRDYNAVNVVYLYLRTAARAVDGGAWGGASVSPNPIRIPARGRGMA
jgi:type IV secretion system protein VirB3